MERPFYLDFILVTLIQSIPLPFIQDTHRLTWVILKGKAKSGFDVGINNSFSYIPRLPFPTLFISLNLITCTVLYGALDLPLNTTPINYLSHAGQKSSFLTTL